MRRGCAMSKAIAELTCRRYHKLLHRFLMKRLPDTHGAEDLVQEVYTRLLRIKDKRLVRSPQAYAFRIASNLLYESSRNRLGLWSPSIRRSSRWLRTS